MTTALILVGPAGNADAVEEHARRLGYSVVARYAADTAPSVDVEARARQDYERLGFGPDWDALAPEARERYRSVARRG